MSVDDRDKPSDKSPSGSTPEQEAVVEALQSETDQPLPPRAEAIAETDAASPHPVTPQGRRRRYLTRRNALIATTAASIGVIALVLLLLLVYRLGYVDNYLPVRSQTLVNVWLRAEIKTFPQTSRLTVEMLIRSLRSETVDRL